MRRSEAQSRQDRDCGILHTGKAKTKQNTKVRSTIATVISIVLATICGAAEEMVQPPSNAPSTVDWNAANGRLSLRWT